MMLSHCYGPDMCTTRKRPYGHVRKPNLQRSRASYLQLELSVKHVNKKKHTSRMQKYEPQLILTLSTAVNSYQLNNQRLACLLNPNKWRKYCWFYWKNNQNPHKREEAASHRALLMKT